MEKEKKVKETKKEVKKEVKKEEKKVNEVEETFVLGKSDKKIIKIIALITAFFASVVVIIMFIFGVMAILSVANQGKEQLVDNNIVVTMVSKLNGYTINETKSILSSMISRPGFIAFEIVIPVLAFICAMILLIIFAKRLIEFFDNVTTNKNLFVKRKVKELKELFIILSLVLLTLSVIFNEPSFIFWVIIELLLGIIYALFKNNVSLQKK